MACIAPSVVPGLHVSAASPGESAYFLGGAPFLSDLDFRPSDRLLL